MELDQLLRAAVRRWYVILAGLLATAGLGLLAFQVIPVTYEVKSSVLMLPPTVSPTATIINPFLDLGGLDIVAGVLARSLTSSESAQDVIPAGSDTEYTVAPDASVSGSVLEIAVTATSPEAASSTLHTLETMAATRLRELQERVDATEASQVRLMVITDNTVAEPLYTTLVRTLVVVAAGGLVLSFLAAVSWDAVARRRRTTHPAGSRDTIDDAPVPPRDEPVGHREVVAQQ